MIELNEDNFDRILRQRNDPLLVMFEGSWCTTCKQMVPVLQEIEQDLDGTGFDIGRMNVDQNREQAAEHQIAGTPTFCYFRDGELVDRCVGAQNKQQLLHMVASNVRTPAARTM